MHRPIRISPASGQDGHLGPQVTALACPAQTKIGQPALWRDVAREAGQPTFISQAPQIGVSTLQYNDRGINLRDPNTPLSPKLHMSLNSLLEQIFPTESSSPPNPAGTSWNKQAATLTPAEIGQFLQVVSQNSSRLGNRAAQIPVQALAEAISRRTDFPAIMTGNLLTPLREAYLSTPADATLRGTWLHWLAQSGSPDCWLAWADLTADAPPLNEQAIPPAITPLLKKASLPAQFYSRLLSGALAHPALAPVCIDLMNYQVRNQHVSSHPAKDQADMLNQLLGATVYQLKKIELGEIDPDQPAERTRKAVADAVALVVSLCDALALSEHDAAADHLREATTLRHRQIQTEAAAALARLGYQDGVDQLLRLSAEPVARPRVLNYAEELGLLEKIPEERRSDLALAESRLALWLADPRNFGVAPSQLELADARELYWPGYEHPVLCYLLRFRYGVGTAAYENLGLVGPLTHAFREDIRWLALDDAYAAFAGWQAEHDEIYQLPAASALQSHQPLVQHSLNLLEQHDFSSPEVELLGHFFGEWLLVISAHSEHGEGFAITDGQTLNWFGNHDDHPVSAEFAYMVYRGRRVLRAFNEAI